MVVATETCGWIVTEVATFTAELPLSATRVVNDFVTPAVGVPVSVQSLLSVRPSGSVPLASEQLYGGRQPAALHAPV